MQFSRFHPCRFSTKMKFDEKVKLLTIWRFPMKGLSESHEQPQSDGIFYTCTIMLIIVKKKSKTCLEKPFAGKRGGGLDKLWGCLNTTFKYFSKDESVLNITCQET